MNVVLVVVVLGIFLALFKWFLEKRRLGVPGPMGVPVLYALPTLLKHAEHYYDWAYDNTLKYGMVWGFVTLFKAGEYILVDPAAINHVLKDNFDNYVKGPQFVFNLRPLLGDGIFNTNGNNWKQQRQTASHLFKVRELRNMVPVFVRHAQELLELLKENEGQVLDFQDLICSVTLDSIGEIAFGKSIHSLKKPVVFSKAFNSATLASNHRFVYPWFKFNPWSKTENELRQSTKILDAFAQEVIDERRQKLDTEATDLLTRYLGMTDEDGKPFSDSYLRDIIMNFILAGRDTTAQTLTWMFYLISEHPQIQQKLIDEIDSELGDNLPSFENMQKLKYMEQVINETLRLYPPVPVDTKYSLNDDVLPNGIKIPAGSGVHYSPWILGRHPDFWGDPLQFNPDRWLGSSHNGGKPVPTVGTLPFIPFNYGPRTCLGIKMAYLEVKAVACVLLQQLTLKLVPGHNTSYQVSITISAKHGMKMVPSLRASKQS